MLNVISNLFITDICKSYVQSANVYVCGFRETLHCGLQVRMLHVQGEVSLLLAESQLPLQSLLRVPVRSTRLRQLPSEPERPWL